MEFGGVMPSFIKNVNLNASGHHIHTYKPKVLERHSRAAQPKPLLLPLHVSHSKLSAGHPPNISVAPSETYSYA